MQPRLKYTIVLACACLFALALCGCSAERDVVTVPDSDVAEQPEAPGISTWVSLEGPEVAVGTTETAIVYISNTAETTESASDFLGIRVKDSNGVVVSDSMAGAPIYPNVTIAVGPGETRSRAFTFRVTAPGPHSVVGYFMDGSETGGEGAVFTAHPTR